jgi:hypothetical protein
LKVEGLGGGLKRLVRFSVVSVGMIMMWKCTGNER